MSSDSPGAVSEQSGPIFRKLRRAVECCQTLQRALTVDAGQLAANYRELGEGGHDVHPSKPHELVQAAADDLYYAWFDVREAAIRDLLDAADRLRGLDGFTYDGIRSSSACRAVVDDALATARVVERLRVERNPKACNGSFPDDRDASDPATVAYAIEAVVKRAGGETVAGRRQIQNWLKKVPTLYRRRVGLRETSLRCEPEFPGLPIAILERPILTSKLKAGAPELTLACILQTGWIPPDYLKVPKGKQPPQNVPELAIYLAANSDSLAAFLRGSRESQDLVEMPRYFLESADAPMLRERFDRISEYGFKQSFPDRAEAVARRYASLLAGVRAEARAIRADRSVADSDRAQRFNDPIATDGPNGTKMPDWIRPNGKNWDIAGRPEPLTLPFAQQRALTRLFYDGPQKPVDANERKAFVRLMESLPDGKLLRPDKKKKLGWRLATD